VPGARSAQPRGRIGMMAVAAAPSVRRSTLGAGIVLMALLLALGALGPFVAPYDPTALDLMRTLQPPDAAHWLGTDHVGRDVLSRVLHGAPRSLGLALLCMTFATALGVALGTVAAARRGWVDALVMRIADLMLAFPGLLLALVLAGLLGGGALPMLIGLKLTLWPQFARLARVTGVAILAEAHVEAAQLAGFSRWHVLTRHVLPGVLRRTVPLAALGVGTSILSVSSLGFLGLGLQPPTPEWGAMISELLPYLGEAPVQLAAPCALIFLATLAFVLVGETLTRRLNAGTSGR